MNFNGQLPCTLRNFALQKASDRWLAPELRPNVLTGKVFGREGFPNGSNIQTSVIVEVEGRLVKTSSGTIYKLVGPANRKFLEFMKQKNLPYNSKAPLDGVKDYWQNGGFMGSQRVSGIPAAGDEKE